MLAFSVTSMTLAAFGENVTVEFYSSFDNDNKNISHGTQSKNIGDSLSLDASSYGAHEFAFWVINGVVRDDLNATSSIRVQSKMIIHAVFSKTGENAVLFIDSNGQLISSSYVLDGGEVTPPSYDGYSKPGLSVNTSEPWRTYEGTVTYNNIDSSRVYVLQYTAANHPVTITMEGALQSVLTVNRNDVVLAFASDTLNFKYWKDSNGKVLSYNPVYAFTASKDITIIAETEVEQLATALVTMTDDLAVRENYETFIGQFELLPSQELVEHGFLLSETEVAALTVDSVDVVVAKSNNYNPVTNEFIMSFAEVTFATIRAYIAVLDGSTVEYYYSEMAGGNASDLFISEYIEDGGNKAIEIFNGTGIVVSLTGYSLKLYTNGSSTASSTLNLSGSLETGEVYVVYNSGSSVDIVNAGDIANNGVANFNGNDAVGLYKGLDLIDIIGKIGEDPGSLGWQVGVGYTADNVLVRKSSNSMPNTVFSSLEWDVYVKNDYTHIGNHIYQGIQVSDNASVILDSNDLNISSIIKQSGDMLLPTSGSRGTTISWSSNNTDIITDGGLVTLPTSSPVNVVLTATVTKGSVVKEVEFTVSVGLTDSDRTIADRDEIVVPSAITEAGDIGLVTSGTYGSSILWSSNTPTTISHEGIVTLPASGSIVVILTATIAHGTSELTKEFTVTVTKVESGAPVLLYSYNFLDGGSSSNNAYANTELSTNVSYAADNPGGTSGTTTWIASYANLSLTTGTRLGGKLVSVENFDNSSSAHIRTNFSISENITKVEIVSATTFGTAGNVTKIFLQSSIDGNTWTTVASTTTKTGTITFDSLNIVSGSRIRILVELTASTTNSGIAFTGIKITGYPS